MTDKLNLEDALKAVDNMKSVCRVGKSDIKDLLYALSGEEKPRTLKDLMGMDVTGNADYSINSIGEVFHQAGADKAQQRAALGWAFRSRGEAEIEAGYWKAMSKLRAMARQMNKTSRRESTCYQINSRGDVVAAYMDRMVVGSAMFLREKDAALAWDALDDRDKTRLQCRGLVKNL